jgi:16S rRNA (guanine527-N7)-methyltransferase
MTEEEAQEWVRERFGRGRETMLREYVALLIAESDNQNLISNSTIAHIWARHLADSAQLIELVGDVSRGTWLDVGSGAGLPGIVVAILTDVPVVLCEPRARRVEFLRHAISELGLGDRITVQPSKIERWRPMSPVAVVSARAVADLSQLLRSTAHCTDSSTVWVLPKGRNAQSEVEAARRNWQGTFHVEPSITQPDSGIVVAEGIRPR